tara:strand:- start:259 stop:435 length:177 start_codon:yes stop_codon:yes gene_type:complete
MQLSRNTRSRGSKVLLIKIALILIIITAGVVLLSKIEFPYPNKVIEKIIPNEKIRIVK